MTTRSHIPATLDAARRMARAAIAFHDALDDQQRALACFPFEGDERFDWTYTPIPRRGLALRDMSPPQRYAAFALFDAGLSARGARTAQQIIAHEAILRETERIENRTGDDIRDPEIYTFALFGTPGGPAPWSWRASGHHLALHFTVLREMFVSATPLFFGANPAEVHHGDERGLRILAAEEDLARRLLASLDEGQKAAAVVDPVAPRDILTKNYRMASPESIPHGIAGEQLGGEQRGHLAALIRQYVERVAPDLSAAAWQRIEQAGLHAVTFAWAGPQERGQGHYYALRGPTFLIEYDNTQNNANHIHSVWRDWENDWNVDVLAEHYAYGNHRH